MRSALRRKIRQCLMTASVGLRSGRDAHRVLMSAIGPSRHFAAARQFGHYWIEADIGPRFMSTRPGLCVMAGLVAAGRVYPTCGSRLFLRNSGRPELRVPSTSYLITVLEAWMPGTRLVPGPAKPDPSAGHDDG